MNDQMDELIARHNAVRVQAGKSELTANAALMRAAQNHAEWMSDAGCLSHKQGWIWGATTADRLSRQKYAYRDFGENIAKTKDDLDEVMAIWLNSQPHHANILGNFQDIGAGHSGSYWCVVFGNQHERRSESSPEEASYPGSD